MKFDWSMIGKEVRANYEFDKESTGIVSGPCEYGNGQSVWVEWKTGRDEGEKLWIDLNSILFTNEILPTFELTEITINGKRYKLVEI